MPGMCRHTSRFLMTWLIFLPWALWRNCEWLTIPITAAVCFLLFGIENIGIQVRSLYSNPVDVLAEAMASWSMQAHVPED